MSVLHWTLLCPHDEPWYEQQSTPDAPCGYYIDVAVDSGTGEKAAHLMDEHMQHAHGERFPAWLEPTDA